MTLEGSCLGRGVSSGNFPLARTDVQPLYERDEVWSHPLNLIPIEYPFADMADRAVRFALAPMAQRLMPEMDWCRCLLLLRSESRRQPYTTEHPPRPSRQSNAGEMRVTFFCLFPYVIEKIVARDGIEPDLT